MNKLIEFLQRILEWLKEAFLWVPRKIFELLLDGLAALLEALPVPDFMANLGNLFGDLSPAIGYFVQPLEIETGVSFIIIASIIRFAIRRIPVVG